MRIRTIAQCLICLFAAALFAAPAMAEIRIVGSGASFPAPIYTTWFKQFSRADKNVQINYQSKGSGAGIRDFQNAVVDFAASDAAMTDEEIAKVDRGVQLLPMTAGEVVLAYNLKGVPELKLPRDIYPAIFLGKVKKWNDPKIAAANPGVTLPDEDITVVTRADSSGTTFVFTKHLSAISPEFKNGPGFGKTVNWPSDANLVKGPKNDGVTALIRQTPGAIGYIEYGFARMAKLAMASLQNKDGHYVAPGLEGGQAALANAEIPENMIVWLSDPSGKDSYPIATYTWMLFYKKYDDPKKAEALRNMVVYCLDEGQKIADKAGYIPLPANVIEKVRKASQNIQ
ncbi:phosphate ABC transporter substrate-binding protein PstS [Desulfosarcina ovata]|uniref:Phosphate-binding protein n=1 Tax=Desulfosarcina ovata subsp. ovata TaxID=2752305 RepID=A0A5K8A9X0_9BACT|nr:phosphate ABC transporter substrate-binding protein PstS [Desulfosarcina ovata]BBO89375.1 phosphate-binding protein [Desulfosarcina ovata subsp. ovata]